jgi:Fibronectin type III domain
MPFPVGRFRFTASALLLAVSLAACGDDDNTNPPATPPAPTGLAAAPSDDGTSIEVTWTAVTGATGYVLERAEGTPPGTFAEVGGDLTEASYTDTDITTDVSYSYRVAAVNDEGTGSFSSVVTAGVEGEAVDTLTGDITADRTLFADTLYVLSGFVKVASGATLTVEAGTTVVGDAAVAGSSLWILRGAQIDAQGTATDPIVFTSANAEGSRAPGDWGGIIIIGNGVINRSGEVLTEGPAGVTEVYSGGSDNADNSGTLRYVRIEFAGYDVSGGAGQELNSLSMYAVGSGTTLEYVQSLAGLDDGFEWWGGAVDGRYLVSYESGDEHFDWTEGYRGRNQFVIGFQSVRLDPAAGAGGLSSDPQGFEADGCNGTGCDLGFASEPFSIPVFANFTLVGPGTGTTPTTSGDVGMVLRRGTGGYLTNGIVARWQSQGLSVRDPETDALMTADSLNLSNILLAENGVDYDEDGGDNFGVAGAFAASNHVLHDGDAADLFTSLTPASLDWTPPASSPPTTGGGTVVIPSEYTESYFGGTLENTTYFGAADPAAATKWWEGWTNYATE